MKKEKIVKIFSGFILVLGLIIYICAGFSSMIHVVDTPSIKRDIDYELNSFRGINTVHISVAINGVYHDYKENSLVRSITDSAKCKFTKLGVSVVPDPPESYDGAGIQYLLDADDCDDMCLYNIELCVLQFVLVLRDSIEDFHSIAMTWELKDSGYCETKDLADSFIYEADKLTDQLIKQYLKANPR